MEDTLRKDDLDERAHFIPVVIPPKEGQRYDQPQDNLGKKIFKGLFYFLTLLALTMSSITVTLQLSHVKYTTYERIGNTECPDTPGTSLVYSGVTISYSFYNGTPSSYSGFRCMPIKNEHINYNRGTLKYELSLQEQVYSGNVTEYGTRSNHQDAACAVCMIEGRGSIMVMPGRDKCLDSWTTEYNGYLMTSYTCVDIEMEGLGATGHPTRVAFLRHEVISSKVSLKYQDNNVLSCVVCSK